MTQKIGVIGTGLMGRGIAEACAQNGLEVTLVKATPGSLEPAQQKIEGSLLRLVKKGKLTEQQMTEMQSRITYSGQLESLSDADIVIESIIEDVGEKRRLFSKLATIVARDAIVATNTSTLKLIDLVDGVMADRFVGLHFFSPAQVMKLVEVATMPTTAPEVKQRSLAFIESLGKTPIPVHDSTGFIVNRLLVPYLLHAISAFSGGLARADHIDNAMKLGCGHPMGPLALCDLIGLDIVYSMSKLLYNEFGDQCYKPPALLRRMVQLEQLGKKSGQGFYDYSSRPAMPREDLNQLGKPELQQTEAA